MKERQIKYEDIVETVARLCIESNCIIGEDVLGALKDALNREESEAGKAALEQIIQNHELAAAEMLPVCQDTGFAVVFLDVGQDVRITGGWLEDAVNEGVRRGYQRGYLRKSIVTDPLRRVNSNDNTPAMVHTRIVEGDKLGITVAPKGGGSENMSALKMMPPSAGVDDIEEFVLKHVDAAGANPCPPIVVGVGIGANFEGVALLAKRALLRNIGSRHPDPFYAEMELELLTAINRLGIGPQGFGGRITALDVHIETYPCHITGIPVAVNINCHAARHRSAVL